jgi:hypothetical protein
MSGGDRLLALPRGTPEEVIQFAEAVGASPMSEVRGYIQEVYRLAPQVGLDPAIVVAQSANETEYWTSSYWRYDLNPAGIGIDAGGVVSYRWWSGAAAARYHLVLVYVYAVGPPLSGNPLYPYRNDGPGYSEAVDLGYGGLISSISDLSGRWAVDSAYAEAIVAKGNEIYAKGLPASQPVIDMSGVKASASSTSANPTRALDGDTNTSWAAISDVPLRTAYVTFDMGGVRQLNGIRWFFRVAGHADKWRIRVSTDGTTWTTIAFLQNPPAQTWQGLACGVPARYVRVQFDNPNGDLSLGYLAEIQFTTSVFDKPIAPTPTPTPTIPTSSEQASLTGKALPLVGSGGSRGATYTGRVRDGNPSSDWHTTATTPPSSGYVYVDLGAAKQITGLRWLFNKTGGADAFTIQVSDDKRSWTSIGTGSNAPAGDWQSRSVRASGRYVRYLFANPNRDAIIGYLAEVQVWGSDSAPTNADNAVQSEQATLTGHALSLVGSGGSRGATSTWRVRDGNVSTDWHTTATTPPDMGYVYVDLGSPATISGVRWLFNQSGAADAFTIQVSDDKRTWTDLGVGSNAPAGEWQSRAVAATGRYVRVIFTNPHHDPVIGYLAEIEVWGTEGVTPSPTPTNAATPSVIASPTTVNSDTDNLATSTPTATASPALAEPTATATATAAPEEPTTTLEPPTEPTVTPTEQPTEPTPTMEPATEQNVEGSPSPGDGSGP